MPRKYSCVVVFFSLFDNSIYMIHKVIYCRVYSKAVKNIFYPNTVLGKYNKTLCRPPVEIKRVTLVFTLNELLKMKCEKLKQDVHVYVCTIQDRWQA